MVAAVAERTAHWKMLPLRYRVVEEVVARDRSSLLVLEVAVVACSIQQPKVWEIEIYWSSTTWSGSVLQAHFFVLHDVSDLG